MSDAHTGASSIYSSCDGKVLLAAVISLSVVVTFVVLLHVYARWFLRRPPPDVGQLLVEQHHVRRRRDVAGYFETVFFADAGGDGLEAAAIAKLPVFVYRKGGAHGPVECVVCLSAMEEDEEGRVLPDCMHKFHVGCIDVWLAAHSTCPVCRTAVLRPEGQPVEEKVVAAAEEVVEVL